MSEALGELSSLLHLSPPTWPEAHLEVEPGDLSKYAAQGIGLGAPMVMMPWDTIETVLQRPSYYDYQAASSHPILAAPTTDAAGGVLYFDPPMAEDFQALLRLARVHTDLNEFAAFATASPEPRRDNYLVQMRLVSKFALTYMFRAPLNAAHDPLIKQPLTIGEALAQFQAQQLGYWGEGYSARLAGCMGGDGDWACEKLAFGFVIENSYHSVYRIWSRAWLVTK